VLAGEVLYCIREEMPQSIEDMLARRVGIQVHNWNHAIAAAPVVGSLLGRELGWSPEATDQAIHAYIAKVQAWASKAAIPLDVAHTHSS